MAGLVLNSTAFLRLNFCAKLNICASITATSPSCKTLGQHCETTATGTLLRQLDIELSEPMLFGLGQGLGFIFWNMKTMDFPFIGGRIKTDLLTLNIAKNLNLELTINETSSIQKAWDNVKQLLDNGKVVGLKLDCYHLEYFSNPFHFCRTLCCNLWL
jgi:hypothetical protein